MANKNAIGGVAGLVRPGKKRYISRNLIFSYERVMRVGPQRTRSFLLPEEGWRAIRRDELG